MAAYVMVDATMLKPFDFRCFPDIRHWMDVDILISGCFGMPFRHLMVWMTFEGQPHWLSRFPQPLLCLDLILEDIMDFCMVSEEFEVFL